MLSRPEDGEYLEYYQGYINKVTEGNLISQLQEQLEQTIIELNEISNDRGNFRYAAGKWSLKEVLGHVADTERIMSYRLLRIARGDATPLASFEESLFVDNAQFDRFTINELLEDFRHVREATLSLIRQLDEEAWLRKGIASGGPVSARALAYIIFGHTQHHLDIIHERYLNE